MFVANHLCCLLDCKAFSGSRVKTRWCIMYVGGANCAIYILVRLRRELVSGEELVFVYLIVKPSLGRGFRLDDVSCIFSNYRYLLTCQVLGGTRVTTRKCFLRVTCVVYLIVRPLRGRGLRLDEYIIYLEETCAIYLLVRPWTRRELRLRNVSCDELVLFT